MEDQGRPGRGRGIGHSTDEVLGDGRRLRRVSRIGGRLSPILIGRDDLLDLASRRIEEAAAGRGQLLLLAGDAGIGKSRLLGSIDIKARGAGFRTAGGFLAPQDRDVPAAALLDMARSMTRSEPWAALGHQLLELADESLAAPRPRRRGLVLRTVDLIVGSLDGPTMLAFDDLQWADDVTLEILAELARATREAPLLLVGVYRTDELMPDALLREWRSRLLTQRMAEEARLERLTLEQTALMTTLILDTGLPAARDVAVAVFERTDGVPLHIEELLGAIGDVERIDGGAIRDAGVPDTLEDAILQRVRKLSPAAQTVARSGAVIGRCFVPDVLAGIMDVPVDTLDAPLRELLDEHFLEPPGPRGLYDFRHQVLREVLYGTLSEGERRRLHARAGEFGRELEGASEIHASVHYERAGLSGQAFRSALHGARVAARLASHREAFDLYRRALANLPDDVPVAERAEILAAFAIEAAAIEENALCEEAAREARTLYEAAGDPTGAVEQEVMSINVARREARPIAERLAAIEAVRLETGALPPGPRTSGVLAALMVELAYASMEALDLETARTALGAARDAGRVAGDEETILWADSLDAALDVLHGQVAQGLDRLAAVARQARDRGFDDGGVTAYRDGAVTAARVMDYHRAAGLIDEGLRYADAIDQSHCAHVMAATGAFVAWADGRWDEAVALGQRAIADRGCQRARLMARWAVGYSAVTRGDRTAAVEHLEAAEAAGETIGAPDLVLAASWALAELDVLSGDHERAVDRTQRALDLAKDSGEHARFAPFVVTGVRARMAVGRPADAERWVADCTALLTGPWGSPALDHAAGLIALAEGTLGPARTALERAAAGWSVRGRLWEGLWARLDLAGCLMRLGRIPEARKLLADVRVRASELASPSVMARVEELEILNRRHSVEEPAWHPLTVREYQVARLIAGGMTNGEIAQDLSISPRTVSAHVEHILAKLDAARRTEIASWVATIQPPLAQPASGSGTTQLRVVSAR
jgi:DNA-binding CsgD family transcriptional regulator